MKIKRLKIINNIVLGNMDISFMDGNMNIKNMIILAGENGCGKTTILDIIYGFISRNIMSEDDERNEINEFTVEFTETEIKFLKESLELQYYFKDLVCGNEVIFEINYSEKYHRKSRVLYKNAQGELVVHSYNTFRSLNDLGNIFKCIYSTSEVNFVSNKISSVTAKDLDDDIKCIRQNTNLATEISQLLVDIKVLDDSDLADWVNVNPGKVPPEHIKAIRIKRFTRAFDYIFDGKKFKGIKNINGNKEIVFEENGTEVSINKLSSGEKQIVFRGGFLLKDSNKTKGAIILIDEPELSLHPKWQMKITEFFRRIFEDEEGKQTNQIFITTHSPFILHDKYRRNDKVIVLKKDTLGNVRQADEPKFYKCNTEELIRAAFDIDSIMEDIKKEKEKTLIITEGKTDWKHMQKAYEILSKKGEIKKLDIKFLEYEETLGDSRLEQVFNSVSMLNNVNKIICIFDRDKKDIVKRFAANNCDYKYNKNKVYSMVIPIPKHREKTPEICIEHLYFDEDIKIENNGKRIYLGNEFSRKSGVHKTDCEIFCQKKDKCGEESYKIIDSDSFVARVSDEDKNIAMSKNDFANNIINEVDGFNKVNFDGFKLLFEKIAEVIELNDI